MVNSQCRLSTHIGTASCPHIVTAAQTSSSSPVTMLRNEHGNVTGVPYWTAFTAYNSLLTDPPSHAHTVHYNIKATVRYNEFTKHGGRGPGLLCGIPVLRRVGLLAARYW